MRLSASLGLRFFATQGLGQSPSLYCQSTSAAQGLTFEVEVLDRFTLGLLGFLFVVGFWEPMRRVESTTSGNRWEGVQAFKS